MRLHSLVLLWLLVVPLCLPEPALSAPADGIARMGRKKKRKRAKQKAAGRSTAAKFRGSSWGGPSTSGR